VPIRSWNCSGLAVAPQRDVEIEKREVVTERIELEPGVGVDVTFADLHESAAEPQQVQPGALRGADQRIQRDVDAIPVGVAPNRIGEFGCPRVIYVLDAHVVQQRTSLRAAGRGEDLRSRQPRDRNRRLPHAAGCRVDQHLLTGLDPGPVVQPMPGCAVCPRRRGGLAGRQAGRQGGGKPSVAGDERAPAAVGKAREAGDLITHPGDR